MKIFIGSSSNYVIWNDDGSVNTKETKKSSLGRIVVGLRSMGFIVEPWWEYHVLAKGENLLDNLIVKANTCDGGIFIFGKDDPLDSSIPKKLSVPRGNVLLECGMFYGAKGKHRTFIIKDGEFNSIKIPSDVLGTNLPDLGDKGILTSIKHFFKKAEEENLYQKFTFYFNADSTKEIINKRFLNWSTKSLYVGAESARKWKAIEEDPSYLFNRQMVPRFIDAINKQRKIDFKTVDNIISFGPGCGIFDNSIVSKIYKAKENISYIPIDINPHLAFEASNFVNDKNPKLRVPFAIVDDFEENYEYVSEVIKRNFNNFNHINVFLMLGGTFSNLEGNETEIAKKLNSWMDNNDYLIIDTFIKTENYLFANDTKRHVTGSLPESYKELMANACIKRYFSNPNKRNINDDLQFIAEIKKDLSQYLSDNEVAGKIKSKYTEIENTTVVTYNFNINGDSKEILIAKRYSFEKIKEFLEDRFKLVHYLNGLKGTSDETSRGLFLLKKKL